MRTKTLEHLVQLEISKKELVDPHMSAEQLREGELTRRNGEEITPGNVHKSVLHNFVKFLTTPPPPHQWNENNIYMNKHDKRINFIREIYFTYNNRRKLV